MNELSATVTVGKGSERHNHNLKYRRKLKHTHIRKNPVIELIPYYKTYKEQINEAVRPYIERYNDLVDERYRAAWERYNRGEIQSKPRKANFRHISFDYYSDHLEDTFFNPRTKKMEQQPMFRSLIIGIGDKIDRDLGRVTEEEARTIFTKFVRRFEKSFPSFLLLGAAMHLDEEGFYHTHIDFKPLYERSVGQGLDFGIGMDSALKQMGYKPEQSVINGSDKPPLLFNAMRNRIYFLLETAMAEEGFRMQYGVSKVKEPDKDSSRNMHLEEWRAIQEGVRKSQNKKNLALEIVMRDEVTPNEIKKLNVLNQEIVTSIEVMEKSPTSKLNKRKCVVDSRKLDKLKALLDKLLEYIGLIVNEINYWQNRCEALEKKERDGVYISLLDLARKKAEHANKLDREQQKVKRLEGYLLERGMTREEINCIRDNNNNG